MEGKEKKNRDFIIGNLYQPLSNQVVCHLCFFPYKQQKSVLANLAKHWKENKRKTVISCHIKLKSTRLMSSALFDLEVHMLSFVFFSPASFVMVSLSGSK